MKNEAELNELWPDIVSRGSAALRPGLASRALRRAAALRDEISPATAWAVALSTAFACLALTLAVSQWTSRVQSDRAIAEWSAFSVSSELPDQET